MKISKENTLPINIIRVRQYNLELVLPLFNDYRIFYKQKPNLPAAKKFLTERLEQKETTIFLAINENKGVGFTQLFKTFSSVNMAHFYILNDLFVSPEFRQLGVGEQLLTKAKEFAIENNALGLGLETATDNPAQKLYEKLGWQKNSKFYHYFWPVKSES